MLKSAPIPTTADHDVIYDASLGGKTSVIAVIHDTPTVPTLLLCINGIPNSIITSYPTALNMNHTKEKEARRGEWKTNQNKKIGAFTKI